MRAVRLAPLVTPVSLAQRNFGVPPPSPNPSGCLVLRTLWALACKERVREIVVTLMMINVITRTTMIIQILTAITMIDDTVPMTNLIFLTIRGRQRTAFGRVSARHGRPKSPERRRKRWYLYYYYYYYYY